MGRGIATRLAREGADVIVNDFTAIPYPDRPWRGVSSVVEEIEEMGRRSKAIIADVSDTAQVRAMFEEAVSEFGKIDIVVSNAGVAARGRSEGDGRRVGRGLRPGAAGERAGDVAGVARRRRGT